MNIGLLDPIVKNKKGYTRKWNMRKGEAPETFKPKKTGRLIMTLSVLDLSKPSRDFNVFCLEIRVLFVNADPGFLSFFIYEEGLQPSPSKRNGQKKRRETQCFSLI